DGDGDLDLLSGRRRRRAVVDDERVGHPRLIPREALELRTVVDLRPAREVGNRALAALAGRKAHGTVTWPALLRHRFGPPTRASYVEHGPAAALRASRP